MTKLFDLLWYAYLIYLTGYLTWLWGRPLLRWALKTRDSKPVVNNDSVLIKRLHFSLLPIIGILALFSENIYGYYRFRAACAKEGGLRVYQKLEPNVGWSAGRWSDVKAASGMKELAFVRYTDEDDHNIYDVRYIGGHRGDETSYEKKPADLSLPVIYSWKFVNEDIPSELRLSRSGYEIYDLRTNTLAIRLHSIGYSEFERDRTILSAPSGVGCSDFDSETDYDIQSNKNLALIFKH
ncbi:hypothetical protein [Chitinimonas sp. BJB300]|uniref:hypothetical protein n=1 Tax=Chitinimonas sp. BJB300 TaxID=1559339 RepID=UPI000C11A78D|nr:hypothetical protein [Chitinimonas sp. BJB300]PHV10540.1 hypothetical protein CSQ89_15620 [Chitinimonas sp. BJB300]TSJ91405.1 hypothetical protein FG002_003730 [Chitinimonas sp. BJB300]